MKRLDEEMRKRFGVRWAPPAPVSQEDRDATVPAAQEQDAAPAQARTKPNRTENEFMLNLMILRNALVAMGPVMKDRAKRAGGNCWRDLRLMTVLCEKVQEQLIATMPSRRDDYYSTYARNGHYELKLNGPIRNPRMVLIHDKYLGAVCEAAMESECLVCMREGSEIGGCLIRQALLEVAPPTEVQDGKWARCEYRAAAGSLIKEEAVTI